MKKNRRIGNKVKGIGAKAKPFDKDLEWRLKKYSSKKQQDNVIKQAHLGLKFQ